MLPLPEGTVVSSEMWFSSPEELVGRKIFDEYLEQHKAVIRRFDGDKVIVATSINGLFEEREFDREIIDQMHGHVRDWIVLHVGRKEKKIKVFAELWLPKLDRFPGTK